jgi:large subunit ribosomal protein L13
MPVFKKIRTFVLKKSEVQNPWVLVDAKDRTLGRLATKLADILRGKDLPTYTPNVDSGSFVIVVNAEKIKVTGDKLQQKKYYTYSGYAGGLKERTLSEQLQKAPEKVITHAVKGMLPKNKLADKLLKKLKVYRGEAHPHAAQKPVVVNL